MALTPEQRRVIARIKQIGRQVGATPKEIKAALETGRVESNFLNLPGGDADSAGWRQERASIYADPTNLDASIRRFYRETQAVRGKYGTAGALAAAVQRPAAQYRGRYQQQSSLAQSLLGGTGGGGGGGGTSLGVGGGRTRTVTTTTPGVDNRAARASLIQSFLSDRGSDVLDFAVQARALKDIAPTVTKRTIPGAPGTLQPSARAAGVGGGSGANAALSWAESKLGSRETGGANQGPLPSYLNQRFGMSGAPWCAMFTSAAVTKGGAPLSARTASVAQVRQKAAQGVGYHRGYISPEQARPGDLILFGNAHIGMVKRNDNGNITYVGGNQSDAVSEGHARAGTANIVRPKYGARRR